MKVLLTGGTGQIGKALLRCVPDGWRVIAPQRDALDLSKPESIKAADTEVAPDLVINAAAYTAVDQARLMEVYRAAHPKARG